MTKEKIFELIDAHSEEMKAVLYFMEDHAATAIKYVLEHASDGDMIISFGSLSTIKMVEDAVAFWEVAHNV